MFKFKNKKPPKKEQIKKLQKENERLVKILYNDRNMGPYCKRCKHFLATDFYDLYGGLCLLNVNCNDFAREDGDKN